MLETETPNSDWTNCIIALYYATELRGVTQFSPFLRWSVTVELCFVWFYWNYSTFVFDFVLCLYLGDWQQSLFPTFSFNFTYPGLKSTKSNFTSKLFILFRSFFVYQWFKFQSLYQTANSRYRREIIIIIIKGK